ncbi:UpxY family transcription antiterminator [Mucilaginibacter sp. UR6-11]|uniref:UpxY family transcription antiterminator n=1 Tax=Mucilaginibacter sp. UR6-11 TaxID=1435644 RepID=UPI001E37F3DC|nr:UpxY family transcription antiterminator [Mucilaginibacter sp. UR6-11]MCC8426379.1 UpxY family transcription antiterminator [Mucilaginibacter sp. UR6-11]
MDTQLNVNAVKKPTGKLYEKRWLVIYTRPRWEKKVEKQLNEQGIEAYCPLRQVQNQWADRKKKVSLPLFNSYVFVRVDLREDATVLYTMGVLNYVYFMGKPAVVSDKTIEDLKINITLYNDIEVVNIRNISVGDHVLIKQGVFVNQKGQVLQVNGKNVLMILDNINCALVTRVPSNQIVLQSADKEYENVK